MRSGPVKDTVSIKRGGERDRKQRRREEGRGEQRRGKEKRGEKRTRGKEKGGKHLRNNTQGGLCPPYAHPPIPIQTQKAETRIIQLYQPHLGLCSKDFLSSHTKVAHTRS